MSYISSVERIGIQKGREEGREEGLREGKMVGLREGIALALELRFGERGSTLVPQIQQITDPDLIGEIYQQLRRGASVEEIGQLISTRPTPFGKKGEQEGESPLF